MNKYVIDRFEDNYAVMQNMDTKEIINIERTILPKRVKYGDIINDVNGKYSIDKDARKARLELMKLKLNRVKKDVNE